MQDLKETNFWNADQIKSDFNQFLDSYTVELDNEIYDKFVRSFKNQVGRRLNASFKKLLKNLKNNYKPEKIGWVDRSIRNVCIRGIPKFLRYLKNLEKKRLKELSEESSKKRQTSRSIRPDDGSRGTV